MKLLVATPTLEPEKYVKPFLLLPNHEWLLMDDHDPYPIQALVNARNRALTYARNGGFDQILFLDADIEPRPDVYELLNNVDADIVYGWTMFRSHGDFSEKTYNESLGLYSAVCLLIKKKPLLDARLSFDIIDTSLTEDMNFARQAKKLGYRLTVAKNCYCIHNYDRDAYKLSMVDAATLGATKLALMHYFPKVFFWQIDKSIEPGQIWKLPNIEGILPNINIYANGKAIALQTGAKEYALLCGKLEDDGKMAVWTPTIPLEINPMVLFQIVYLTNYFRSQCSTD